MAADRVHRIQADIHRNPGELYALLLWDCNACGQPLGKWAMSKPWAGLAERIGCRCDACGTSHQLRVVVQVLAATKRGRR